LDPLSTAAIPTRQERRRRETADRIVEAASELFVERGIVATTISEICERADVARQTFFNHFATKQDLTREIAVRGREFFAEMLGTALREGADTGERLRLLFAAVHGAAIESGPMHLEVVAEVLRVELEVSDEASIADVSRQVERLLRKGRGEGTVSRQHALEDQVGLILGAVQYLLFEWTHRPDFPIAERSARMARLLADALAPGPAERGGR
jgi:AcrR family transcriptional regulator